MMYIYLIVGIVGWVGCCYLFWKLCKKYNLFSKITNTAFITGEEEFLMLFFSPVLIPWAALAWVFEKLLGTKDDPNGMHAVGASGFVILYIGSQMLAVVVCKLAEKYPSEHRVPASVACICPGGK